MLSSCLGSVGDVKFSPLLFVLASISVVLFVFGSLQLTFSLLVLDPAFWFGLEWYNSIPLEVLIGVPLSLSFSLLSTHFIDSDTGSNVGDLPLFIGDTRLTAWDILVLKVSFLVLELIF
jgi:hypothetical protein